MKKGLKGKTIRSKTRKVLQQRICIVENYLSHKFIAQIIQTKTLDF